MSPLPAAIAHYRIIERLGRGGQGEVFRAWDTALERNVVIKWALQRPGEDEESLRLKQGREGAALARIDHPGVVRVYGAGVDRGRPFLVLEHLDAPSLADRLGTRGRPRFREAAKLVARLAETLDALHRQGIFHLDLKPANVLIDASDRPRLIDFGLGRLPCLWGGGQHGEGIRGTLHYMAPESAMGQERPVEAKIDIFGLGAILYELLTGRPPYQADTRSALLAQASRADVTPPRRLDRRIPKALERICLKAMARAPEDRHPTAGHLAQALRRYGRRPAVGITFGLILPALAALALVLRPSPSPRTVATADAAEPRVIAMTIKHYQGDKDTLLGIIGTASYAVRQDDAVNVHVQLDTPAYCYLLALNTNGVVDLRHPADPSRCPPRTSVIDYPLDPSYSFSLDDGPGMQAFVLVASRQPLPPYPEWQPGRTLPWGKTDASGVWRFDGRAFEFLGDANRGKERKRSEPPAPLAAVCHYLQEKSGADAIHVVAFPVRP